jgi:hypothetical protein
MNQFRIQEILKNVNDKVEAQGWEHYFNPSFTFQARDIRFSLSLRPPYSHPSSDGWEYTQNVKVEEHAEYDDFDALIARVQARIRDLPKLEDHLRGLWRQKLADLTEEGEALGFALEYTEMLKATARALAENALTAPRPSWDEPSDNYEDELPL